jgi:hypothetical protein
MRDVIRVPDSILLSEVATKATAAQNKFIDITSEMLTHTFYILYQLVESIWLSSRTASVPTVVEGQNSVLVC